MQQTPIIGESDDRPDADESATTDAPIAIPEAQPEFGGRPGPDPTRYGDWEKNGRCIDF